MPTESKLIAATQSTQRLQPAITLDGVAVQYRVARERPPSFKEFAIRWLQGKITYGDFWALRDISLQIMRGEAFGVIGSNGAGKSTLLKTVARVLRPTLGRVRVRGRIAPLLELGAGFDFELTGRENIFMNAMILGQSRADIARRLDRIVDFAEVREFIDQPLRTYSSGMMARLGFSVATDLPPEVLIVDEVLAVGDAEFQLKSRERMERYRANGATILVVSHQMATIQAMCQRAVWLAHGRIQALGPTEQVVRQYLAAHTSA